MSCSVAVLVAAGTVALLVGYVMICRCGYRLCSRIKRIASKRAGLRRHRRR